MFDRLKSLLRAPEQKLSRTARLITLEGGGRARWTPRDFAALAREGYARNAIVYRAVRLIAESISGLAFVLSGASRVFWRQTVLPLGNRIAASLTKSAAIGYGAVTGGDTFAA